MYEEITNMLSSLCKMFLPKPAIYPDATPWTVIIRNELGMTSFLSTDFITHMGFYLFCFVLSVYFFSQLLAPRSPSEQEESVKELKIRCANAITQIAKLTYKVSNLQQQKLNLSKELSDANDALRKAPTENALLLEVFHLEALEHRQTIIRLEIEIKRLEEASSSVEDPHPRYGTYMPHFEWQLKCEALEKRVADEVLARQFAQKQAADMEKENLGLKEKLLNVDEYVQELREQSDKSNAPKFRNVRYQAHVEECPTVPTMHRSTSEPAGVMLPIAQQEIPILEGFYSPLEAESKQKEQEVQKLCRVIITDVAEKDAVPDSDYSTSKAELKQKAQEDLKLHRESSAAMAEDTENIRTLSSSVAARDKEVFDTYDNTDWYGQFRIAHDSYVQALRVLEKAFAQTSKAYHEADLANQQRLYEQFTIAAELGTKLPEGKDLITFSEKNSLEIAPGSKNFQLKESIEESAAAIKSTIVEKEYWYKSFLELEAKRNKSPDDGDIDMDDAFVADKFMGFQTASQLVDEMTRLQSENDCLARKIEESKLAVMHSGNEAHDLAFQHGTTIGEIKTLRDHVNVFRGRDDSFKGIQDSKDPLAKVHADLKICKEDNDSWSRQYNEKFTLCRQLEDKIAGLEAERKELRKEIPWDRRTSMAEDFLSY